MSYFSIEYTMNLTDCRSASKYAVQIHNILADNVCVICSAELSPPWRLIDNSKFIAILLFFYCRSGNNIRHITGLSENLALKHLDLSDNTVTSLSDLSHLYALKVGIHWFDDLIVCTYIHILDTGLGRTLMNHLILICSTVLVKLALLKLTWDYSKNESYWKEFTSLECFSTEIS